MRITTILAAQLLFSVGLGQSFAASEPEQAQEDASPDFTDERAQLAFSANDDDFCAHASGNEIDLGNCLFEQEAFEERRLNEKYRFVMTLLSDARKNQLRSDERRWIKFRTTQCEEERKQVELCSCGVGWTMQRVCMIREARNRTELLKTDWSK